MHVGILVQVRPFAPILPALTKDVGLPNTAVGGPAIVLGTSRRSWDNIEIYTVLYDGTLIDIAAINITPLMTVTGRPTVLKTKKAERRENRAIRRGK